MSNKELDPQVFYSLNVVPKFRANLDRSSLHTLLDAGLQEMIENGVAMQVVQLEAPYTIVMFPKSSPSNLKESSAHLSLAHTQSNSSTNFFWQCGTN